jgi:tryptophan synthase beta chain
MDSFIPTTIRDISGFSGRFGEFGGQYVAETLMPGITAVEQAFAAAWNDPEFHREFDFYLRNFVGRPSPLFLAQRLSAQAGGQVKIYLKREDLNHTGAHKINNTIGQALLAKRMGKQRLIAETGAGQHGVATATAAAIFGFQCDIFMGEEDIRRQAENVKRMKLLGAQVIPVRAGAKTLKDAMNEAMRNWIATVDNTFYVIGSVAGPHPYPLMVREFQRIIGEETRRQLMDMEQRLPDKVIACVGGGSNAMGIFSAFIDDPAVELIGVEAAGSGLKSSKHAASLTKGQIGVLHGSKSYVLQTPDGQIQNAHSISAGLDYPGVGPEHAWLKSTGRVQYVTSSDEEAVQAFHDLTRFQGIIPALECCHAIAYAMKLAPDYQDGEIVVVNLSGRGDKDMASVKKFQDRVKP